MRGKSAATALPRTRTYYNCGVPAVMCREAQMPTRLSWLLLLPLLIASTTNAKDKKTTLPELVLRARTVLVVIRPDAGEPLDHPNANATARGNVEKALME